MIISIRTMRKELKKKLKYGTYISSDIYPEIEKYMKWCLVELNVEIAKNFEESNDRKVTKTHVEKALLKLIVERMYEDE